MDLTVKTIAPGRFQVVDGDAVVAGPFDTNGAAWRAIDRIMSEPVNPAEKRTDFATQKFLRGAA